MNDRKLTFQKNVRTERLHAPRCHEIYVSTVKRNHSLISSALLSLPRKRHFSTLNELKLRIAVYGDVAEIKSHKSRSNYLCSSQLRFSLLFPFCPTLIVKWLYLFGLQLMQLIQIMLQLFHFCHVSLQQTLNKFPLLRGTSLKISC